jgi:quinol monooxygenase YgiN
MLSFTVRLRFDPDHLTVVREQLQSLTLASRLEPGCVTYVAHFVEADSSTVLIYEQYADQAALDHHRTTAHFHQYAIGGFYQLMKERHIENLSAIC